MLQGEVGRSGPSVQRAGGGGCSNFSSTRVLLGVILSLLYVLHLIFLLLYTTMKYSNKVYIYIVSIFIGLKRKKSLPSNEQYYLYRGGY